MLYHRNSPPQFTLWLCLCFSTWCGSLKTKWIWTGIRAVTLITEFWTSLLCSSVVFPSEIAEKAQNIQGEFHRAWQTFCGFASLHKFFVPIVGEGGDVQRPGSCSEWVLLLGHAVLVGQFGCCSWNPPSGMQYCLGPLSRGGGLWVGKFLHWGNWDAVWHKQYHWGRKAPAA